MKKSARGKTLEKKARVGGRLNATRAAVEEGIVPGGGVARRRASKAIDRLKVEGDEKVAAQIVKRALERLSSLLSFLEAHTLKGPSDGRRVSRAKVGFPIRVGAVWDWRAGDLG